MSESIKYPGFWVRLLAHNIDLLPIILLCYALSFIISRSGYDFVIIGGVYFLYHIIFEYASKGVTPGKKWTKIRVVNLEGTSPSLTASFVRNISKILSLLIFFGGFVLIGFDAKRRGLHDYIGSTLVIFDED